MNKEDQETNRSLKVELKKLRQEHQELRRTALTTEALLELKDKVGRFLSNELLEKGTEPEPKPKPKPKPAEEENEG